MIPVRKELQTNKFNKMWWVISLGCYQNIEEGYASRERKPHRQENYINKGVESGSGAGGGKPQATADGVTRA